MADQQLPWAGRGWSGEVQEIGISNGCKDILKVGYMFFVLVTEMISGYIQMQNLPCEILCVQFAVFPYISITLLLKKIRENKRINQEKWSLCNLKFKIFVVCLH